MRQLDCEEHLTFSWPLHLCNESSICQLLSSNLHFCTATSHSEIPLICLIMSANVATSILNELIFWLARVSSIAEESNRTDATLTENLVSGPAQQNKSQSGCLATDLSLWPSSSWRIFFFFHRLRWFRLAAFCQQRHEIYNSCEKLSFIIRVVGRVESEY